jgi:Ribophorin I
MTFLGPAIVDLPVETLTVRVILPEGATGEEVHLSLPHELTTESVYSYLDVLGQRVVTVKVSNYVPEMNTNFGVVFVPSKWAVLQKVAMVAGMVGVVVVVLAIRSGRGAKTSSAGTVKEHVN